MKLEFESNTTTFPSVETDFVNDTRAEKNSAAEILAAGIKAAQEGRRSEARNLLLRVTEMDSENENAWLWLASISEYPEELLVFLNSVLKINPENERALEWSKATKTLLSKTFVQRGIDASKDLSKSFAKQCFLQAIVHDNQNEMAWLWLASASDSDEEKSTHLQKVLSINPENLTAQASLKAIRKQMSETLLQKAFAAVKEGENDRALDALQEVFNKSTEIEDAWILKSFLVATCAEKLECFEKVLELNAGNNLAQANAAFLRAMFEKGESKDFEQVSETFKAELKSDETEAAEEFLSEDKSPTQELEFPQSLVEENDFEAEFEEVETQMDSVEMEEMEAVELEAEESVVEDFDVQTEFSEQFEEEETETFYADSEEDSDDEVENQVELVEEAESFEDSENETESAVEDFEDVEEVAQVSAFQEQEISAPPVFEEFEEEVEEIHETEPAAFYSDFEEVAENQSVEEDSADEVYEIEADELLSTDTLEEIEVENDVENVVFEEETQASEEFAAVEDEQNVVGENDYQAQAETVACRFCYAENEPQAFVCDACAAVLTLSDLEMLLAGNDAHKDIISDTIEQIEKSKKRNELDIEELKTIAVGYFNLKNPKKGVLYLNEAARLNPDDIVLSSQVNALKIRLAEIEKQESIHNSMPKNRTILVVDDSATVRKLISGKLEKCGHEVVCAIDGVDALEKLKEISPDLILLDINMPRMDGYQVCKLIRGDESMKDTPVVMISGKDGFFDKVRGRMAGTTGYITKPFGPETLMKMVETYIVQPV
jgi:CheY-like chemotaxis protein